MMGGSGLVGEAYSKERVPDCETAIPCWCVIELPGKGLSRLYGGRCK